MQFQNILFDLDGTLTDSAEGITNAVRYALKRFGIDEPDRKRLECFVGPPLWESFERCYGFSPEDAARAVAAFREYYNDTGVYENAPYPGIPELLSTLCGQGRRCWVATSKPTHIARLVVTHFHLAPYLVDTCGIDPDARDKTKAEVVADVLAQYALDPERTVMIGDRMHDVEGGRANKLRTIGVTWGYGSFEELLNAGAGSISITPQAVLDTLDWWDAHPTPEAHPHM